MVQIIGIMIAAYIFTRMGELMEKPAVGTAVKVFAVITAVIALGGCFGLLIGGATSSAATGL